MTRRVDAITGGLDADERDLAVVHEPGEHADRVAAAADARERAIRQPPGLLEDLLTGLVADAALQIAHDGRVGSGPDGRAEDVVRVADVGHPVADRGGDRLLECPRAVLDRADLGAEHPHALDVGRLAAHVLRAHVDDALQAEERAGRGARDAVRAGARLGDHARLAHALGEQRLPERVVELVRARVHEVLALEPDSWPTSSEIRCAR